MLSSQQVSISQLKVISHTLFEEKTVFHVGDIHTVFIFQYLRLEAGLLSFLCSLDRRGSDSKTQDYFGFSQEEHSLLHLLQPPGSDGNCSQCILIFYSSLCASPLPDPSSHSWDLMMSWAAEPSKGSLAGGPGHGGGAEHKAT